MLVQIPLVGAGKDEQAAVFLMDVLHGGPGGYHAIRRSERKVMQVLSRKAEGCGVSDRHRMNRGRGGEELKNLRMLPQLTWCIGCLEVSLPESGGLLMSME